MMKKTKCIISRLKLIQKKHINNYNNLYCYQYKFKYGKYSNKLACFYTGNN